MKRQHYLTQKSANLVTERALLDSIANLENDVRSRERGQIDEPSSSQNIYFSDFYDQKTFDGCQLKSIGYSSVPKTTKNENTVERLFNLWSAYQPRACSFKALYARPYISSLNGLYFLSEEVHKKVYIMKKSPSKYASKDYVYHKMQEIASIKALNKKEFHSLQEQPLQE